jgi:hypothetical protein
MSLLQQDSQSQDDAARGEELTKGSSNVVLPSIIAVVVVGIAIFLYAWLGEQPNPDTGDVTTVIALPTHWQTSRFQAAGAAIPKDASSSRCSSSPT